MLAHISLPGGPTGDARLPLPDIIIPHVSGFVNSYFHLFAIICSYFQISFCNLGLEVKAYRAIHPESAASSS